MNDQDEDNPNVCTACISDKRFKDWISENGEPGPCGFKSEHGDSHHVVPVSEFAVEVDSFFREHYGWGKEYPYFEGDSDSPSYETHGEPYADILMNELECDEEIVTALSPHLPDASQRDVMQGDEPFYDDTRNYESIAEAEKRDQEDFDEYWYENRFRFQWEEFCEKVQFRLRFFQIKEPLDELFGKAEEYEKGDIRPIYSLPVGQKIYRARLVDDRLTKEKLGKDPAGELNAPPKERTRAGRMNVEYIPAFYAAFSEETAVAEIRPGIGEEVAIGEFTLKRELKVFDFTAFARAGHEKWKDVHGHTRYDFIKQMEEEISKPILPFDRQREYIPTQIVAEYLKEYFGCDAVIYRSSMIKDRDKESRNIVILNNGQEFIGEGAPLAYTKHNVKEVANVTYELFSWPF